MGLLTKTACRIRRFWNPNDPHATNSRLKICRVEELEPRAMMAVDVPNINVGVFYYEADSGQDTAGDRLEITFNGGAPGTQLTHLEIDTDKDGLGLSQGDAFFDTAAGGLGASLAFPLTIVDQTGITQVVGSVTDGGTKLVFDFTGFDVGEKLVVSIDVDEKGFSTNSSNAVVEGEEFEGSKLFATFSAPHFFDTTTNTEDPPRFFDEFSFAALGLNLPPDGYIPPGTAAEQPVRTAGVQATLTPVPLPITIAGTVFNDVNLNNVREAGDAGIGGVTVSLWEFNGAAYVATGKTAVTDANGNYTIDGVLPGQYRLVETQPGQYFSVGATAGTVNGVVTGAVTSVDVISDITLLGGQNSVHNDFAESLPVSLSGHVYHDADQDGIRDPGEEPIGGVTVTLERLASTHPLLGPTTTTVVTDANGFWSASGLMAGTYVVREIQPLGYYDGLDRAGTRGGTAVNPGDEINGVFLPSGASGENYDFGELKPVKLSGLVHTDTDFDCILDPGELPLSGVTVFLLDALGNRIASTTTDANGYYEFANLAPGTYGLEEIQPAGYYDGGDKLGSHGGTSPANDQFAGITIGSGQVASEYNFCEHPPAQLSGKVYIDDNNNATIDAGEAGIGGVTLELLDAAGNPTGQTTTTLADGSYTFTNLAPGVYGVAELQPAGYYDGLDSAGTAGGTAVNPGDRISGASLAPAAHGQQYNFGELRPASISGRVHRDENGNCILDPGELPLEGVQIFLLDATGTRILSTFTDANGVYRFDNIKPGTYGVEEIQPAGVFDGEEMLGSVGGIIAANDLMTNITVGSGVVAINYDFCEHAPVSLAGRVYIDDNNNGMIDAGEVGIGGATLQLLDAAGNATGATTTTAADGSYKFDGLAPGVYGVAEVQPAGYYDGLDTVGTAGGAAQNPGDRIVGATLNPGVYGTQYNFGELRPTSVSGRVHADTNGNCEFDPGEVGIAGVTIVLLDANGTTLQTTQTAADGTYSFVNLAPGSYGVRELQPAGYFDGGQQVGSAGGIVSANDQITGITLASGQNGADYDFCEKPPATLGGQVHTDVNGNCLLDPGEAPLPGVTIYLLDAAGNRIASTTTDANGRYLFTGLAPNTSYGVEELQPAGYFDGGDKLGSHGGAVVANDRMGGIVIGPGQNATEYNFCEHPPASLGGRVHVDQDGDCILDPGESPLPGVTIYLLDASGQRIRSTTTDANGQYLFTDLDPNVSYGIEEIQPFGVYDGDEHVGSSGGTVVGNDRIEQIGLAPGENAVDYNFCELAPVSIAGRVYVDRNNNGQLDGDEPGIAGAAVTLLDANGNSTGLTVLTDATGFYHITGLAPGVYGVSEAQPAGYFDGDDTVGTAGGFADAPGDRITGANLLPGVHGTDYNFGELLPAEISGYVFRDGPSIEVPAEGELLPQDIEQLRGGQRTADDVPIAGVVLQLGDSAGELVRDANGDPITAVTDANGFYRFTGLEPGTYTIFQRQPDGYQDGIDTPGTTGGLAANPSNELNPQLLAIDHGNDAIVLVTVAAGANSQENNFSEVQTTLPPPPPPPPPFIPFIPPPERTPAPIPPPIVGFVMPRLAPVAPPPPPPTIIQNTFFGGSAAVTPGYSWHLSIIDAGHPRGGRKQFGELVRVAESRFDAFGAVGQQMTQSRWKLKVDGQAEARDVIFGMADAIPVTGDFNGDGISEVGVFRHGQWFIDINGNGIWDAEDLWAELGSGADLPVTGDWDGDGKTDIGIFGPSWPNDQRAVAAEPGLPDPDNKPSGAHKNVPPKPADAAAGYRKLKLTAQGRARADLVDHVFYFGHDQDKPVTGDWNGDGVDTVGIFHDGMWILDDNGDGQWLPGESMAEFGRPGDIPVVGDFNGDGIDDLAVYRDGTWYIDTNNNRQLDPQDTIIHYGGPNDRPVVGDWDGDGREEVGLYQDGANLRPAS